MNRFEDLVHTSRREQGELSVDRLGELWAESQSEMFGDSVELTEGYRTWWSYIPHFIGSPATCTRTPTASCWRCRCTSATSRPGPARAPATWRCSPRAARKSPEELGRIVGVDLADPGFWTAGLDIVERQLQEAEAAAEASGRLA